MPTFVIFGGFGFVGQHLIKSFLDNNKDVKVINADLLEGQEPLGRTGKWIKCDIR
jgi:dTDP-D-glucose 4,6-dehydratase